MSDIRSFFGSKCVDKKPSEKSAEKKKLKKSSSSSSKNQKKKRLVIESDSDEDPLPSKLRKSLSKSPKSSAKRKHSADKDVICVTPDLKPKKSSKIRQSIEQKQCKKEVLKPTTAATFFGTTPVSHVKRKKPPTPVDKIDESFFTDKVDDNVLRSPLILPPNKKAKLSSENTESKKDDVIVTTPKGKSLSEKLASKVNKTLETTKTETPECKMKEAVKEYLKKGTSKSDLSLESPASKENNVLASNTPQSNGQETTPTEKKKNNYWAYKQRDGPTALGSKQLPKASENCLAKKSFVITGVLDAFHRDDIVDCVQRYGGKVTSAISGRTSYIIVGREPGMSKMEKATKLCTKQLDEDGFIELLKSYPVKDKTSPRPIKRVTPVKKATPNKHATPKSPAVKKRLLPESQQSSSPGLSQSSEEPYTQSPAPCSQSVSTSSLLWVDKYKPRGLKNIVGQQGEKSNLNKLKRWMFHWKENNTLGAPKKNFLAGKEDGSIFKAALLSGPPGVGKTTTAALVCQDLGFTHVEMNASDTRGKKALETVIKDALSNTTVACVLKGNKGEKHALIMDEVDGMAGTEDRGGMQELIQLVKKTKIPIICMCNDRNHPKVRSLANYCFDLRFHKPRLEQVKGFALSVACRESLKIQPQAMEQIVIGANQDIRQVLHNLQMWSSTSNSMSYDEAKTNAKDASKNIKTGPFDVVKQLYTASDATKLSIKDKTDLFFTDYSFVPLFMQENYLAVNPALSSGHLGSTLKLMSETADSIADANLVESLLRGGQNWSLLPLQGVFSTVIPSMKMAGYLGQRIDFPRWLGKNSSTSKHDRILQELKTHMSLSCHCAKSDINIEYLPLLKQRLSGPLLDTNAEATTAARMVIETMNSYNLSREDWDSVMEITKWENESDVIGKIPSKVKSAFTRLYNKDPHKTPYAVHQAAKKSREKTEDGDDEGDADDQDNDDIEKDAMIKVKKEPVAGSSRKLKATATNSKKKPKALSKAKAKK